MQGGKPVVFTSKALTQTQKAYAQIEKELITILFGCEKKIMNTSMTERW